MAPSRVILVPPSTFADTWAARPRDAVAFGLKTLSEADKNRIRTRAFKVAKATSEDNNDGSDPVDVYNDHLMRLAVVAAICDPNDMSRMPEMVRFDDEFRQCLTETGARFLFDELLKMEVETSPTHPEANEQEVVELINFLAEENFLDLMDEEQQSAFLRHLRFALDIKREATLEELTEPE
jgi:hypothetical protein